MIRKKLCWMITVWGYTNIHLLEVVIHILGSSCCWNRFPTTCLTHISVTISFNKKNFNPFHQWTLITRIYENELTHNSYKNNNTKSLNRVYFKWVFWKYLSLMTFPVSVKCECCFVKLTRGGMSFDAQLFKINGKRLF